MIQKKYGMWGLKCREGVQNELISNGRQGAPPRNFLRKVGNDPKMGLEVMAVSESVFDARSSAVVRISLTALVLKISRFEK